MELNEAFLKAKATMKTEGDLLWYAVSEEEFGFGFGDDETIYDIIFISRKNSKADSVTPSEAHKRLSKMETTHRSDDETNTIFGKADK